MNEQDPQLPPTPPVPEEAPVPSGTGPRWWEDRKRLAGAVAGVAVVAAVGVGGGYALGSAGGGSDAQTTGRIGGQFIGQFPGQFRGGPPAMQGQQGPMGGADGEQHVTGTLTAVGTGSVTVRTASGSKTYRVTAATEILQDAANVTLSQLTTGEPVVVHVFPGATADGTAERVLVGTSATEGGFGPPSGAA